MLAPAFQAFIDRLEHASDEDDLRTAMSVITGALGFTGFDEDGPLPWPRSPAIAS
jgi:hypothetical protein